MNKKRNLAVLMAAATVATSVAPVFADTTTSLDGQEFSVKDSEKLAQFKKEIEVYFNTKYTTDKDLLDNEDNAGQSVYTISVSVDDKNTFDAVPNMKELDKFIVNMDDKNDTISVKVEDKGHKEVDGKILDNQIKTYKSAEISDLVALKAEIEALDGLDTTKGVDFGKDTIVLSLLNNDEKLVLKQGAEKTVHIDPEDATLVVGEPIYKEDEYGNKLDKDGAKAKDETEWVCLGFEKYKEPIKGSDLEDARTYDLTNEDIVESVKANELYNIDLGKLTQKGNDIAQFIEEYNSKSDAKIAKGADSTTTKLVIRVPGIISGVENKFSTLTITGTEKEIADLEKALFNTGAGAELKINTLAGLNREATSIEVSKEAFDTKGSAENVVLVSGYAIADGLAATPFAKAKTAPVLLTGKDKISDKVMDEIQRVKAANGKVYLVGGTNSLSTAIEDQLDSKYIKFERIAGADRADTSLKIAKKMVNDGDTTLKDLFVAGGYAEADAMSVAAVASSDLNTGKLTADSKVDPILLGDRNGLTKDQLTWLGRQDTISTTYIAGGENSVPASVTSSLNGISEKTYRLAGDNRQATNAEVLTEFYKEENLSTRTVYVAKSDNNGLVDALPAGVLAAIDKSPVILATDALNNNQDAALKAFTTSKVGNVANKTQIGNGIADKVWKAINDIK